MTQLTTDPAIHHNIYCEQPYCSADGNRILISRSPGGDGLSGVSLEVFDLEGTRVTVLDEDVDWSGSGGAAWQGVFYYWSSPEGGDPETLVLKCLDMNSLELRWLEHCRMPRKDRLLSLGSVSPDQRYLAAQCILPGALCGCMRVDLQSGETKVLHSEPDICNPHFQFSLADGKDILVQHNRGSKIDAEGNILTFLGPEGATLYLIDWNGENRRPLKIGKPFTSGITGHEAWIADTREVALTLGNPPFDDGKRVGNLVAIREQSEGPRVLCDAPWHFNHLSISKCGRYFVVDTKSVEGTPIVIGSVATGRYRILCYTGPQYGRPQYTHPHPYLTSNNEHVIFNSFQTGIPQVYAATVPQDFLESLE